MRNTKKKGFTIVELVIVVAVIAILAAVLIPTFTGIVQKARQNADEQTVANMNKIVAAAAAEEDFVFAADAVNALYEGGFNIGKFKTFAKGFHYAYGGKDDNQFYLLNKEGKIVFPKKADAKVDTLWGFFNNEKADKIEGVKQYIALSAITDANLFNKDDCVFGGNDDYTIDLNNKTITVADTGNNIKLVNGFVVEGVAGNYDKDDKSVVTLAAADKTVATATGAVEVKNKLFTSTTNLSLNFTNATSVKFENCTFELSGGTTDKTVTFNGAGVKSYELINCTFNMRGANVFINGNNGKPNVTVKNCTFSSGRGLNLGGSAESSIPHLGKVVIEGNTFIDNGTAEGKPSLQISGGSAKAPEAVIAESITIKNNDFLCKDIAIRIHESTNALTCDKVVISGNSFADGAVKIDGDGKTHSQTIANALLPKFD